MNRRTRWRWCLRKAAAIAVVVGWWGAAAVPAADASWTAQAGGAGRAASATMPSGNQPVATLDDGVVLITWAASTGATPVDGYRVEAYTGGVPRPVGGTCAGDDGVVVATSCTDDAAPAGASTYTVTPVRLGWSGVVSAQSEPVNID